MTPLQAVAGALIVVPDPIPSNPPLNWGDILMRNWAGAVLGASLGGFLLFLITNSWIKRRDRTRDAEKEAQQRLAAAFTRVETCLAHLCDAYQSLQCRSDVNPFFARWEHFAVFEIPGDLRALMRESLQEKVRRSLCMSNHLAENPKIKALEDLTRGQQDILGPKAQMALREVRWLRTEAMQCPIPSKTTLKKWHKKCVRLFDP